MHCVSFDVLRLDFGSPRVALNTELLTTPGEPKEKFQSADRGRQREAGRLLARSWPE